MRAMTAPLESRSSSARARAAPGWRLLRGLSFILALTAVVIGLFLWWQDRPLREIESALDRQDYEQALSLANSYLAEFPDHSRAQNQKGRALTGLGHWSEAIRIFEQVGTDSPASERAWSEALLHQERWSEALPLLRRLGKLTPDDPNLLHERAACEAKLGHFDESIAIAERLTHVRGHEDRGRLLLGTLHFQNGNNRGAIAAWKPILQSNPGATDLQLTSEEFFAALGRALLDDGQPAAARPCLERAVGLQAVPDSLNALAEACEQLGDLGRADELWQQVVDSAPANRAAREGLARRALERRDADDARRWLEPLLDRDDLKSSTAYLMQRAAVISKDKTSAAHWDGRVQTLRRREKKISALEQAMREAPQSFWARAVRAHRFATEGNTLQALLLAQELLEQTPEEPFVLQLVDAIRNHSPLPFLDLIPYDQF